MHRLLISLALVVALPLAAQVVAHRESVSGWCEQGNKTVSFPGVPSPSSTKVQQSFPSCTVTVYTHGTVSLATIYSDDTGTALANPFTANSDGSYQFYADDGRFDVIISGGGMSTRFTHWNRQVFDYRFYQPGAYPPATGAVSRSLKSKVAEVVSVKDFGATGDGSTDDTTSIQAAIDYVTMNGGKVTIPPGEYKITGNTMSRACFWLVPSLALPSPQHSSQIKQLAKSEAIQLFVARASAALPGFKFVEENAATVVRICRRLDGIPLAIELAAARVKLLDLEQIAARLDDSLQLLTRGSPAAAPRYQTMRAALDWSYQLLQPREQPAVLEGPMGLELELLEVERLGDVVVGPESHRLDGALDGAVRGDHDHGGGLAGKPYAEGVSPLAVFKTAAFNHSATTPEQKVKGEG